MRVNILQIFLFFLSSPQSSCLVLWIWKLYKEKRMMSACKQQFKSTMNKEQDSHPANEGIHCYFKLLNEKEGKILVDLLSK